MMQLLFSLCLSAAFAGNVVTDATVHTPDGPKAGWGVSWNAEGQLVAVGPSLQGDAAITGKGLHITPGFIATDTQLGVVEISLEKVTRDDASNGDPIRAAFVVTDAYNPLSSVVRVTRLGGITTAIVSPTGGFVSGQSGAVQLAGTTQAETVISRRVGLQMGLSVDGSHAAGQLRIRELFEDAEAYRRGAEPSSELSASRLDLEALYQARKDKLPIVIGADRASDIESVMRLAEELDLVVILRGGAEAWMHADALAKADIPVIVDPLVYGSGGVHQLHGRADNARLLAEAGVRVILGGQGTHNARALRYLAGNAVRGGLSHEDALRAITENPALAFGLADRGRLIPGATADLAVWDGDPLEIGTRLLMLIIDGEPVQLTSRQTELVDAWREAGNKPLLP